MRLWLVHSSEVSLQDQIVTQLSLAILTRELAPGARLPSVRALARRFALHPNTVSLAYRRLVREGWAELRTGSGVYVLASPPGIAPPYAPQPEALIGRLMADLVASAAQLQVSPATVRNLLEATLAPARPVPGLLLLEPDPDLAEIVIAEIVEALGVTPARRTLDVTSEDLAGALVLVLPSKEEVARSRLPASARLHVLALRSVPESLATWLPAPGALLVGVFSRWPRFLELGRTMLIAAGFPPEGLVVRDARKAGAAQDLHGLDGVVCDALSVALVPEGVRAIVFRLLAEDGLESLRDVWRGGETT